MKKQFEAFVLMAALLLAAAILAVFWQPGSAQAASVKTLQVTIGASTTQITTNNIFCRQIFLQNNQTHTMRVGDSTTSASKGVMLANGAPGGSLTITAAYPQLIDLSDWFVNGTQNDVLDASCTQ